MSGKDILHVPSEPVVQDSRSPIVLGTGGGVFPLFCTATNFAPASPCGPELALARPPAFLTVIVLVLGEGSSATASSSTSTGATGSLSRSEVSALPSSPRPGSVSGVPPSADDSEPEPSEPSPGVEGAVGSWVIDSPVSVPSDGSPLKVGYPADSADSFIEVCEPSAAVVVSSAHAGMAESEPNSMPTVSTTLAHDSISF